MSSRHRPMRRARLGPSDTARVAAVGIRTRPLRAFLSALGIAIGVAAMVAVVGVSASSQAEIDRTLDKIGTNLLAVGPGQSLIGEQARLPSNAVGMVKRIEPVLRAAATGTVDAQVYRTDRIPTALSGGLAVLAADLELPDTIGMTVRQGNWLNPATAKLPAAVLGAGTAQQLGIDRVGLRVWIRDRWFSVTGILDAVALAPELDRAALVGWESAAEQLGFQGNPTTIYCRAVESKVEAVRAVLAASVNPAAPNEVLVSRPSDALAAQRATDRALSGLLLGLGAVGMLVGGVGVANTMVVSVLERRSEIGLRRSFGATRGQIRTQFLSESFLLSLCGGLGGTLLGLAVTAGYATFQGWPVSAPWWVLTGSVAATALIGVLAGLYPAVRASRLSPTEALATP